MQTVGIRDLVNRGSAILDQLQTDQQPVLITKHGRPVAVLHAIDQDAFYDHVLEHAPEFVASIKQGEQEIAAGDLGTPLDEVFTDLEGETRG
jgi:prevent-host-death family protein